jgi:osmotically-inducible protein OsmY
MHSKSTPIRHALLAAAAVAALGGCAPLVIGGAAVGGAMAVDRRSVGVQIEDEAIQGRVNQAIVQRFGSAQLNVNVTAYNRNVLLAGQTATDAVKADVEMLAKLQQNVGNVFNELEVGPLSTTTQRSNDTAISAKVHTALLQADGVPAGTIRVTTEKSVVYLMGKVTTAEGDAAARTTSRVSGVARVVKLFEAP